jgi:hypothetical protein
MWYDKAAANWFCLHVEGMYSHFMNVCHQGSTIWYYIEAQHEDRLLTYLHNVIVAPQLNWPSPWDQRETAPFDIIRSFLYSKSLFVHPGHLAAAGIPVHRLEQGQNMAVLGEGTIIHFGISGDSRSLNEAVNYLPESWLTRGLRHAATILAPHIDKWAKLRSDLLSTMGANPQLPENDPRRWLLDAGFADPTSNMMPIAWIQNKFPTLADDLQRAVTYNSPSDGKENEATHQSIYPYTLTTAELSTALDHCRVIGRVLAKEHVKRWYKWIEDTVG